MTITSIGQHIKLSSITLVTWETTPKENYPHRKSTIEYVMVWDRVKDSDRVMVGVMVIVKFRDRLRVRIMIRGNCSNGQITIGVVVPVVVSGVDVK